MRLLDAYCATCQDPTLHEMVPADPGACRCRGCGTAQVLVAASGFSALPHPASP